MPSSLSIKEDYIETNYPTDGKKFDKKSVDVNKGDLVLFPSSLFHHTVPFKSNEERVTFAFDIIPQK